VPVGVAYAAASGVPAIYGLYATIAGLIAYALFGPSRILVYGRTRRSRRSSSDDRPLSAAIRRARWRWRGRWRWSRG
jgi:hypothetical protein